LLLAGVAYPAATSVDITGSCIYSDMHLMMGKNIAYTQHQTAATSVDITGSCIYSDMLLMMGENIFRNM